MRNRVNKHILGKNYFRPKLNKLIPKRYVYDSEKKPLKLKPVGVILSERNIEAIQWFIFLSVVIL